MCGGVCVSLSSFLFLFPFIFSFSLSLFLSQAEYNAKASVIKVRANFCNILTFPSCDMGLKNRICEKYRFLKKCEKILKDSKIHSAKTNDRRDFWLAPSEREKSALS